MSFGSYWIPRRPSQFDALSTKPNSELWRALSAKPSTGKRLGRWVKRLIIFDVAALTGFYLLCKAYSQSPHKWIDLPLNWENAFEKWGWEPVTEWEPHFPHHDFQRPKSTLKNPRIQAPEDGVWDSMLQYNLFRQYVVHEWEVWQEEMKLVEYEMVNCMKKEQSNKMERCREISMQHQRMTRRVWRQYLLGRLQRQGIRPDEPCHGEVTQRAFRD